MRLISNQESEKHLSEIIKALENADEIIICTAFLKMSGLNFLIEKINLKDFKTIFYVGTNFYQTEPAALKKLYSDGHTIFLNTNKKPTFHPKIFYFKNEKNITVFVGSSNLTSGGLLTNVETSIEITSNSESIINSDLKRLFESFNHTSNHINNIQIILDYERRFDLYKKKHKAADIEFKNEEQLIIEEERKREEERLKKEEEERLKKENKKKPSKPKLRRSSENRLVITPEYLKTWPSIFEEFKEFRKLNNGNPIVPKKHKLHTWYIKQKFLYKSIDENGNRYIPPLHLELLNNETFYWGNPNELQWMLKWENHLKLSIEYSNSKKLPYTWVTVQKNNPKFKYKAEAQWCMDQRMRLKGEWKKRKITEYEIKRLKEAKFLEASDSDSRNINEDALINNLILISELKKERLSQGIRRWLPSQTDKDPKIAKLGNWLNDKIEAIKKEKKQESQRNITTETEEELIEIGIDIEFGFSKTYFEDNVKEYFEMKKLYPLDNPTGEERKKYSYILQWLANNRTKFETYPLWRKARLKELGLV
ncbi:phospholipase D-like domain-containing protein [Flavobacterium sp.]|uniref:phospholipase D-like domain-containing protein n=1 Tax=Flavobacterium sp. TaxID=239 RepID=UPI00374CD228